MILRIGSVAVWLYLAACSAENPASQTVPNIQPEVGNSAAADLDEFSVKYVILELGMGLHDAAHVDAYFGPEEYRRHAEAAALDLDSLHQQAGSLIDGLDSLNSSIENSSSPDAGRIQLLRRRLVALRSRISLKQGDTLPFDEESRQVFGVVAPSLEMTHFSEILADIDALIPGDGPLPERVRAFRDEFRIPPDRLSAVIDAAVTECRERTKEHIELPGSETISIEYVSDKPWGAYNWFQGNARSLMQINTDTPTYIDNAVNLGCHEAYPGHHTMRTLHEQRLVNERGWVEYSVVPLWSPVQVVSEGAGNYGILVAFPGEERINFETDILWPLAGLDTAEAERYYELQEQLRRLRYVGLEAARGYLSGELTREQAEQRLVTYGLQPPELAARRIRFAETYRSYVINYSLGMDLVREYIEHGAASSEERWARFEELLLNPNPLRLQ